jgi:hypothetical protein
LELCQLNTTHSHRDLEKVFSVHRFDNFPFKLVILFKPAACMRYSQGPWSTPSFRVSHDRSTSPSRTPSPEHHTSSPNIPSKAQIFFPRFLHPLAARLSILNALPLRGLSASADVADVRYGWRRSFVMDLSIASFNNPIKRNDCVRLSFLSLFLLGFLAERGG